MGTCSGYVCGTNTTANSEVDTQADLQEEGGDFAVIVVLCIVSAYPSLYRSADYVYENLIN